MHRLLVTSHAYRMASTPTPDADRLDPSNALLHRRDLGRLDAESIRDAILAVSGRLDPTPGGPSIPPHLTRFMDGRGRPAHSGPLDGAGRRTIYLTVRRNFLSPLLLAFDFPTPSAPMGRRNVSNVPAQALTLLNDPFVADQARSGPVASAPITPRPTPPRPSPPCTRPPSAARRPPPSKPPPSPSWSTPAVHGDGLAAWADLAHVLFNVKEFVAIP